MLNNETDSLTPHLTIGAGYLGGICKTILALVPEFANKRVIFLLDDFSVPKIPEVVQKVLLPIIWNPGAGYTFVVTSHSESMERVDARNISYLANREFKEINLGAQYISSSERVQSRKIVDACVDDIFSKRVALTHPEKTYSIKERLGVRKGITIAKEIRKRNTCRTAGKRAPISVRQKMGGTQHPVAHRARYCSCSFRIFGYNERISKTEIKITIVDSDRQPFGIANC